MIGTRTTARTAVSAALIPSSAVALSWAVTEGDGLWSVAVLAWIVTLWVSTVRAQRYGAHVERC